jgi:hypothetical protein
MKKSFITKPGGGRKLVKGPRSGCHASRHGYKFDARRVIREDDMDHEIREALGYKPDALIEIVSDLDPINDCALVVSCGLDCEDDTEDSSRHLFIAVDPPVAEKAPAPDPIQRRSFRPKKRQVLPIDNAIRCCA